MLVPVRVTVYFLTAPSLPILLSNFMCSLQGSPCQERILTETGATLSGGEKRDGRRVPKPHPLWEPIVLVRKCFVTL